MEGKLVRLRAPEPEDAARLNPLFNDPEVLAGLSFPFPQPVSGFEEWIRTSRTSDSEVNLIIETLDGEPIGGCGLRFLNLRNRSANLGIWIGKPHWNHGYGTDAVRTLCRFAFRHLNLHRIDLHVYATNPRAIRSYEKVGFQQEGTLREAQFVGGQHVDEYVMGLLAHELIDQ